jgi:hypothetical protein
MGLLSFGRTWRVWRVLFRALPERWLKNQFRLLSFKSRHCLPIWMLVNKDETIIDVGAADLRDVKLFMEHTGQHGRVITIEPEPQNAEMVRSFIEELGSDNLTLIPKAAWCRSETVKFLVNS